MKNQILNLKSNKLVSILFIISLLILVSVSIFSIINYKGFRKNLKLKNSYENCIIKLESIHSDLKDVETGERGYVITGNESFLDWYYLKFKRIVPELNELKNLETDTNLLNNQYPALNNLIKAKLASMDSLIMLRKQNFTQASNNVKTLRGKQLMDTISSKINYLNKYYKAKNDKYESIISSHTKTTYIFISLSTAVGVFLLLLVFYLFYIETGRRKTYAIKALNKNRVYEILSNINQIIIHTKDTQKLLDEACRIAVEDGRFVLAWIGVEDVTSKMIKPLAKYGKTEEFTKNINISIEKQFTPDSPCGLAFRDRKYSMCNNIQSSDFNNQFKENCLKTGIKSIAAFPLNLENGRDAVFSVSSSEVSFFDEAEIKLFEEIAGDISYAFEFRDTEVKRFESDEKLKSSEIRYRRLFESAKDGIIILDAETGMIDDINPYLIKMLGFSYDDFIGKTIWDIGFFKDIVANKDKFLELQTKEYVRYENLPLETVDGHKLDVEFVSNLYLADNREVIQCNIRDNTDRKLAEKEILKLNSELEQRVIDRTIQLENANKELESFAYSVAHDLRSPLRAIDGFAKIISNDYSSRLDDEGRRLLNIISCNIGKMDKLIIDLLALSKVTRSEFNLSRVDMKTFASSVYSEIATAEVQKKFTIQILDIPDANGDPVLLRQLWVNLISNAIKYTMPKEDCRIEIGYDNENRGGCYYIKNTGVGFNSEYKNKLFGVFQRLHSSQDFEGTGVGLAIVQRIVNRHGGDIWAESIINEGATFYFKIKK